MLELLIVLLSLLRYVVVKTSNISCMILSSCCLQSEVNKGKKYCAIILVLWTMNITSGNSTSSILNAPVDFFINFDFVVGEGSLVDVR